MSLDRIHSIFKVFAEHFWELKGQLCFIFLISNKMNCWQHHSKTKVPESEKKTWQNVYLYRKAWALGYFALMSQWLEGTASLKTTGCWHVVLGKLSFCSCLCLLLHYSEISPHCSSSPNLIWKQKENICRFFCITV